MAQQWAKLWQDRSGQDLIEYALLVGLVAILAASVPFQTTMTALQHIYNRVYSVLIRYGG